MTKNDNDIFIKSLVGVKPIKKSNKIKKPIPKQKILIKTTIPTGKTAEEKPNSSTKKKINTPYKFATNETHIIKKLKKGKISIDKKVDFHGLSLDEAKQLFLDTINFCFFHNYRCILFITGKGINKKENDEFFSHKLYYSKIRNSLLSWTSIKEAQQKILAVQQAAAKYGGDGAFFVYLRKNKS